MSIMHGLKYLVHIYKAALMASGQMINCHSAQDLYFRSGLLRHSLSEPVATCP
jgi:hypothetical protein